MGRVEQFDLEGLTLQQLRYFNAVAEGETFADAAALNGISQSALSQGIARLERVTGTRLLERDGRRRRLTDAGELVAAYGRRVLGASESLAAQLEANEMGLVGRLRLGMIDAAALYLFTDRFAAFRADHPGVELSITVAGSGELEQRVADFRDDIAIVVGPIARGVATSLILEPMHLYGPEPLSPDSTFALYPRGSRTRTAIEAALAGHGISQPNVIAESGNPEVLRELSRLNGSFTVLPEPVGSSPRSSNLLISGIATRPIAAVVRDETTMRPIAGALLRHLVG